MAYCNTTTDLSDQFPDIGRFLENRVLENWYLSSGQTNTYETRGTGQVNMVFDDGQALSVKTSIADVESNAASFYYHAATNIVYVHAYGSDDLTTATITIEAGENWSTLKTRINNRTYNFMNNILSRRYPTPVPPKVQRHENTDDYDYILTKCNALLTIAELMKRRKRDDPDAEKIYKSVWNMTEDIEIEKGLLNQLVDGDIVLTDWTTAKEAGSANYWPDSGNTTDTPLWVYGTYTGETYERWKLEFDNTAATGTATFKLSRNGGTTWDLEAQETFNTDNNDRRIDLLSGLSVVFDPDTGNDYTDGDFWTIEVFPLTDDVAVSKIGSARLHR